VESYFILSKLEKTTFLGIKSMKYIFVTGGVFSSVGKGVVAGSIGKILQEMGVKVGIQKLDPYINVDPGTLSPYQHGEVFVTADGAETDLDLGHYERFLNIDVKKSCSVTAGQIYARVIEKERAGSYLGGTIQVIPHITTEIKESVYNAAKNMEAEVLIVEVGGTIGDLEGAPFFEAIRQMQTENERNETMFVHVTWFPYILATRELKTKPSQHSVRELRSIGIVPDFIIARADYPVDIALCKKLAHFSNIPEERVIPLETETIPYKAPLMLEEYSLGNSIVAHLGLQDKVKKPDWSTWQKIVKEVEKKAEDTITIGLVGKYVELHDAYISVKEALLHAGRNQKINVSIKWIFAEKLTEDNLAATLKECNGILVPGGFGERAIEGKILAARWARIHKVPYLGLCLGMQVLCIELARAFIDKSAHSVECDEKTKTPIVALMDDQKNVTQKGGTMRLGIYPCKLLSGSKAAGAYLASEGMIYERHRHRFEFNNTYRKQLEEVGLIVSGESPDGSLVEIVELKDHPFMVASQFHPEFLSRPGKPHSLFTAFIKSIQL